MTEDRVATDVPDGPDAPDEDGIPGPPGSAEAHQVALDLDQLPGGARSAVEAVLMVIDEPVTEESLAQAVQPGVVFVDRAAGCRRGRIGAVRAALWLQDQPPGLYDMQDVLGLK